MIAWLMLWLAGALALWAGLELLLAAWRVLRWTTGAALMITARLLELALAPFAPRRPGPRTSA